MTCLQYRPQNYFEHHAKKGTSGILQKNRANNSRSEPSPRRVWARATSCNQLPSSSFTVHTLRTATPFSSVEYGQPVFSFLRMTQSWFPKNLESPADPGRINPHNLTGSSRHRIETNYLESSWWSSRLERFDRQTWTFGIDPTGAMYRGFRTALTLAAGTRA